MSLVRVPSAAGWLSWFQPELPGISALAAHTRMTGAGEVWADRWPGARLLMLRAGEDVLLRGAPSAVAAGELTGLVQGFVDAPAGFEPVLRAAAERVTIWPRVVQVLAGDGLDVSVAVSLAVARPLTGADAGALGGLPADMSWIWRTWGGPGGLCDSGFGWGAFDGGEVVSVACSFYVGQRHEEVGVATRQDWQRRGRATRCAAGLCADIRRRGRAPSWTTSPDNPGSLGVARRLGFRHVRDDVLYLVDIDVPS